MWQRKQTIYLVLVVILMVACCCFTYGESTFEPVVAAIAGMDAVDAILKYENRKKQMQLCRIGMLISFILLLAFAYEQYKNENGFTLELTHFIPVVSIILFELAYKGVKADDDLVKSADRIR